MMNVDLGHNNGHIVNKITRRVDRDMLQQPCQKLIGVKMLKFC